MSIKGRQLYPFDVDDVDIGVTVQGRESKDALRTVLERGISTWEGQHGDTGKEIRELIEALR